MLSGAKHLQYLLANKQQILRLAQDDNPRGLFPQRASTTDRGGDFVT